MNMTSKLLRMALISAVKIVKIRLCEHALLIIGAENGKAAPNAARLCIEGQGA